VRLEDDRLDDLDDLDLDARDVGARTGVEPLITGAALGLAVDEVASSLEAKSRVGGDNLEGVDLADELLAGVQGEGLLLEADLLITVAQLDALELVEDGVALCSAHNGVGNDDVVAGRDHHHGLRAEHNLLMILTSEGLGTDLNTRGVQVVVQDMNIEERLDANDSGVRHNGLRKSGKPTGGADRSSVEAAMCLREELAYQARRKPSE